MKITPGEIDKIEEVGELEGKPVKMVRTKGGFWIAIARKKGKHEEEALAAGSHPAIVKYNLEKIYGYQPHMMKSEGFAEPIVAKHSHYLSEDLRKSGHDIFSIQSGENVEFQVTKQNCMVSSVNGTLEKNTLVIENLNIPMELAQAMAGAAVEKAVSCQVGLTLRK